MDTRLWCGVYLVTITMAQCNWADVCMKDFLNCSQPGVLCRILPDPDCNKSTELVSTNDPYPGPVTSFSVTTSYVPPDSNQPQLSRSRVEATWRLPAHGSHTQLQGFEVRMRQGNAKPYCFIYDMAGAVWESDSRGHEYKFKCAMSVNQYDIGVTSLPRAASSRIKEIAIVKVAKKFKDVGGCPYSSCWTTDLVIYNSPCNNSLTVTFTNAPDDEYIEYYMVSLLSNGKRVLVDSKNVSHKADYPTVSVTLTVPTTTNRSWQYYIKVIPQGKPCEMPSDYSGCINTKSGPFYLPQVDRQVDCSFNGSQSERVKTELAGLSDADLGGIIVGVILIAGIITAILVILAKRPQFSTNGAVPLADTRTIGDRSIYTTNSEAPFFADKHTPAGFVPPTRIIKSRKLLYMMYSNDNKYHRNAVGFLTQFLTNNCNCDVIYDVMCQSEIRSSKQQWISQSLQRCDYVLMVNSEGSYHLAVASQQKQTYPPNDCDSCLGDMFTPAFKILQDNLVQTALKDKLILVNLSYTKAQYRNPPAINVSDQKNYQLMTDIEQLYLDLHGLENGNMDSTHISDLWFDATPEGQALLQAIRQSGIFMAENPQWFHQIHGRPVASTINGQTRMKMGAERDRYTHEIHEHSQILNNNNDNNYYLQHTDILSNHTFRPPQITPDDATTVDSSILGEMVSDLNANNHYDDSGFDALSHFVNT